MSTDYLTSREKLRANLRELEFRKLPAPLRRTLTRLSAPDPFEIERQTPNGTAILIHVPKTGGTSVAHAIGLGLKTRHVPVSRLIAQDPARFGAAYSFAFVRNPLDRLFSGFNYLLHTKDRNESRDARWARTHLSGYATFEAFVHDLEIPSIRRQIMRCSIFRRQIDWITVPGSGAVRVNFLGRYENLVADSHHVLTHLGLPAELGHARKAADYLQDSQYTPAMRQIAEAVYAVDLNAFDY